MKKFYKKETLIVLSIVLLFLLTSYLTNIYVESIKESVFLNSPYAWVLYFFINILSVIIAPVSALPLMPLAVKVWGPLWTFIIVSISWTAGAGVAFNLARRFGKRIFNGMIDIKRAEEIASNFPQKNLFWLVVLARIVLPVDILSYAIGLFTKMDWRSYLGATLLGIAPFALAFSYLSEMPIEYQILALIASLIVFVAARPWRFVINKTKRD